MIATAKKVFLESNERRFVFKEMTEGIPLPPKSVVTRWGTWLEAASYYASHINDVQQVIRTCSAAESSFVRDAQGILCESVDLQCSL